MKKIIILLFLILSLSGCYDYKEVNELSIVSGIGIDYKDNEYIITLEVLNDSGDKNSVKTKSFTVTSKGKNLSEAIENTSALLTKRAYLPHTKLLVVSKTIAKDKLTSIYDYMLRNTYIHEKLNVVISDNPKELMSNITEKIPTPSLSIVKLINSNEYSTNTGIHKTIYELVTDSLSFGKDSCLNEISYDNENETFIIDGLAILSNDKYKLTINNELANYYNILSNISKKNIITTTINGQSFAVALHNPDIKIDVGKDKITINANLKAKDYDNPTNIVVRDAKNLEEINKLLNEEFSNKVLEFIKILQDNNSDILGFAHSYYSKTREKYDNLWQNAEVIVNANIEINKKGLIFEVKDEN